jgi:hypothetical protein
MKGQISRLTFDPEKRYSGVPLQMGRMVTDADVNERELIGAARTEALGADAVAGGVPAAGGAIALTAGKPALRAGDLYAEGVRGDLRAAGDIAAGDPLALYDVQADFPRAPARAGPALVYADLWERAVFANEDETVIDPAFHGADTSFRTRTMTQIRLAPVGTVLGEGAFPRKGNALLTATLREEPETPDPCDPCAQEFDLPVRTGDFLFRLEVVDVTGPANAPQSVRLLYSAENAGERHSTAAAIPGDFKRSDRVYEFYSVVSEAHQGVFADPATRVRSAVIAGFPAAIPARTDGEAGDWPFVRRWDGGVDLDLTTGTPTALLLGPGEAAAFADDRLTITTAVVQLELETAGRSFVAGDYWLVTVREFAAEGERVTVASPEPVGIRHHYLALFEIDAAGAPKTIGDADRRRLSFPALSNLPASHVGFIDNCPKLYSGAQNVQAALDALCAISAADIAFTNNCERLYGSGPGSAVTVQQALDKLCETVQDGGSCCTVTVGKDGDYPDIATALKDLIKDDVADICLCLMAGTHGVDLTLGNRGEPQKVRLEIKGCGRGQTRLVAKGNGLQLHVWSVVLANIDIAIDEGASLGLGAETILLSDLSVRGVSKDAQPLVVLSANDRLDVVRCDLEALSEKAFDRVIGALTAVGLEPREVAFDRASVTPDRGNLVAVRRERANALAAKTDASRKASVRELTTFLRDQAATLTVGEKEAVERLGASITAGNGAAIDKALNDLRVKALQTQDGLALVIADRADTSMVDCRINGVVGLYGVPVPGNRLKQDELSKLADGGMKNAAFKPSGRLSIRDCGIVAMALGSKMVEALRAVSQGNATELEVFATLHLNGVEFPSALDVPLIEVAADQIKITDCEAQHSKGPVGAVLACTGGILVAVNGPGPNLPWFYLAKVPRVAEANRGLLIVGV